MVRTATVVWVVAEPGVSRTVAELKGLGYDVTLTTPEKAPDVAADLRIVSSSAFPDLELLAIEYGQDARPTLLLADSRFQELEVLAFIRSLDEIGRADDSAIVIAKRLARLAKRYDGSDSGRHDLLTGVLNRTSFEVSLRRAVLRFDATKSHALLCLNLDRFKLINDRFGHIAGDEILKRFGAVLRQQRQLGDLVARHGGDEFSVVLSRQTRDAALESAEQIRRALGTTRFELGGESLAVSVSAGLAFITAGTPLLDVARNAEQALYEAKHLGKDALVVFEKSAFRRATEDSLTGLHNHGYFESKLVLDIKHAQEQDRPLTIALLDLDEFRTINKRPGFGFPAGNEALKTFAKVAAQAVRSTDWIARCGGDEFCVVMPGTALEDGVEVAERVRAVVASTEVRTSSCERFSITTSVGVAQWSDRCGGLEGLIQKAADAVNEAKRRGRNCVVAG